MGRDELARSPCAMRVGAASWARNVAMPRSITHLIHRLFTQPLPVRATPNQVAATRSVRKSVNKMRYTGWHSNVASPRARDGPVRKSDETGKSAAGRSRRVRGEAAWRVRRAISAGCANRAAFGALVRSTRSIRIWPGSAGRCSGHFGALPVELARAELSAPTRQRRRVLHRASRACRGGGAMPRRAPSSTAARPTCQFRHFCARPRFARRRLGTLQSRSAWRRSFTEMRGAPPLSLRHRLPPLDHAM